VLVYSPTEAEWLDSEKSPHNLRDLPSDSRISRLMASIRGNGWAPYIDNVTGATRPPVAHREDRLLFLRGNQRREAIRRIIESGELGQFKLSDVEIIIVEGSKKELDLIASDEDSDQLEFDRSTRWRMYKRFRGTHRMNHINACKALGSATGDELLLNLYTLHGVEPEIVQRWEAGEKMRRQDIVALAKCAREAKDKVGVNYAPTTSVPEPETLRGQLLGTIPMPEKGRTCATPQKADAVQIWLKGRGYLNSEDKVVAKLARMLLFAVGRQVVDGHFIDGQANGLLDAELGDD